MLTGLSVPCYLALDVRAGKLYWTDRGTGKIQRANLDGSQVEDVVTGLDGPVGLALDVAAGKLYWTHAGFWSDTGTGKIQRANLDGSHVEDLVTTDLSALYGLALDVAAGKLYWVDAGTRLIQRANLEPWLAGGKRGDYRPGSALWPRVGRGGGQAVLGLTRARA